MFETGIFVSAIAWAIAVAWLAVSLGRALFRRWRRSGLRQAVFAACLFWASLGGVIACNQFAYLDYGLSSRDGLAQARAEKKKAREAERAVAKAKAALEREAAAKAQAREDAKQAALAEKQATIDAGKRRQEADKRAAEAEAAKAAALAKKCNDTTSAFVMSQEFVKRNLKAPSTAEFPWITDDRVAISTRPGCAFHVVGWVDAQNGFGAQIRSTYRVDLKYLGDKAGTWRLTGIKIE